MKNFEHDAVKSISSGIGAYAAASLFGGNEGNAVVNLFGASVSLPMAVGLTTAAGTLINDYLIEDTLAPRFGRKTEAVLDSAALATRFVGVGGASAGLFYLSNPSQVSAMNSLRYAGTATVGSIVGEYAASKAMPLLDAYIF